MPHHERHRDYSAEDKANALALLANNKGNVNKTAAELGIPMRTLANWKKMGKGISPQVAEMADGKRRDLADLWEDIAYKSLGFAGEKAKDESFESLIKAAATSVDKMRLLRDQSTGINENRSVPATLEQKEARAKEIAAQHGLRIIDSDERTGTDG